MAQQALEIPVVRLAHGADLPLPAYASDQASGMDLLAAVAEPLALEPGGRALAPTGLALALPPGYEGQVRPRSGLAAKSGITVLNAPGTIDADYRGEVKALLINLGEQRVVLERGDRIAQLVIAPVCRARWDETEELEDSTRGKGGFGSTGVSGST